MRGGGWGILLCLALCCFWADFCRRRLQVLSLWEVLGGCAVVISMGGERLGKQGIGVCLYEFVCLRICVRVYESTRVNILCTSAHKPFRCHQGR